jgi:N-glycosylase/DNA lyase
VTEKRGGEKRFLTRQTSQIGADSEIMKETRIAAPDFDLAKTLQSGQVFHWEPRGDGFAGTIGDAAAYIQQRDDVLLIAGPSAKRVANYFALDHPLPDICRSFPRDGTMVAAAEFCQGLRVMRQPKWECLATFICSSMKQVVHIRQISLALRQRFGTGSMIYGTHVYAFPRAQRLARASEAELRGCALGYRARNLAGTARAVAQGEADLEAWSKLADEELRSRLCGLPGVGAKVANCVMLFAYERLRAFPIDVWIERVLKEKYLPGRRKMTAQKLREFCDSYFGEYGGYAQQYLFHHARMTKRRRSAGLRESRSGRAALLRCC